MPHPSDYAQAQLRFHGVLASLVAGGSGRYRFLPPAGIKDAVESCRVPHTEVDRLTVNGIVVDFRQHLLGGDQVDVFPPTADHPATLWPGPTAPLRFLLDVHLGRLARDLRLCGFDCLWPTADADAALVHSAITQNAILLSRDRGLLCTGSLTYGMLVQSSDPQKQLLEVVERYDLRPHIRLWTRCSCCNTPLTTVSPTDVADAVPLRVLAEHQVFQRCPGCHRIYWRGGHVLRTEQRLARLGLLPEASP